MAHPIFFLRHGKPDLPYKSYAEMPFSVLCELAGGKLDPGIQRDRTDELLSRFVQAEQSLLSGAAIFSSPRLRARQTAGLLHAKTPSSADPVVLEDLTEVSFDLSKIYTPPEAGIDMDAVNQSVLTAMGSGEHAESMEQAIKRVERVFEMLRSIDGPVICITHDFFMRVIELMIRHKGEVEKIDPQELLTTQTNHPCEGFQTDHAFQTFVPWKQS